MTRRKSKRELERSLDGLDAGGEHSIQEWLWADLKAAHDGDLTPAERRLLDEPERHLSETALEQYRTWRGSS